MSDVNVESKSAWTVSMGNLAAGTHVPIDDLVRVVRRAALLEARACQRLAAEQTRAADLARLLDQRAAERKKLEDDLAKMQANQVAIAGRCVDAERKAAAAEKRVETLTETEKALRADLARACERPDATEVGALKSHVEALKRQVAAADSRAEGHAASNTQAQARVRDLERDLSNLRANVAAGETPKRVYEFELPLIDKTSSTGAYTWPARCTAHVSGFGESAGVNVVSLEVYRNTAWVAQPMGDLATAERFAVYEECRKAERQRAQQASAT